MCFPRKSGSDLDFSSGEAKVERRPATAEQESQLGTIADDTKIEGECVAPLLDQLTV
jgi:hypothetical protein